MNFITSKEASEKWNISARRVIKLASEGRIPGARLMGNNWLIPADSNKPADGRRKSTREEQLEKDIAGFRFPCLTNFNLEKYDPPLNEEEFRLRKAMLLGHECRFEDSREVLGNMHDSSRNKYNRLGAMYMMCLIFLYTGDYEALNREYTKFSLALKEDFPHKKEMELLLFELSSYIGSPKYLIENFNTAPGYEYDDSALPHLICVASENLCNKSLSNGKAPDLDLLELNCRLLEDHGYMCEAQSLHLDLALLYSIKNETENSLFHVGKALKLSEQYRLYFLPALYYFYASAAFDLVLPNFSPDFSEHLKSLAAQLHEKYVEFTNTTSVTHIFSILTQKDYQYIYYAMMNIPVRQITKRLGKSEATINNHYADIYARLGVKSKKELKDFYNKSLNSDGFIKKSS